MRELKFRAWNNKEKRWSAHQIMPVLNGVIESLELKDCLLMSDRLIIEQYTGLKDKNDKEIYEGDIVRCWNGLDYSDGSVKWSENSATYFVKYFEKKDCFDEDDWLCDCYCEVVGNIHEKPELTGGEE